MAGLADLLQYLQAWRPPPTPVMPMLPKSSANVTAANIPSATFPNAGNFINAISNYSQVGPLNAMRQAQTLGQGITNQTQFDAMGMGRRMLGQAGAPSTGDLSAGRLAPLTLYDTGTSPTSTASPSTSTASPTPPTATGTGPASTANAAPDPWDTYADKVIGAESGGNPDAKNPRSSATGPGQFLDSTWLSLARQTFPVTAHPWSRGRMAGGAG